MRLRTRCALLLVPALGIALAAAGNKPSEQPAEPRYDTATTVDVSMIVVETREVAKGSPLAGTHLMVRPESARPDTEAQDVYLAPTEFIKMFNLTFHSGDRIEVIGSKVKLGTVPVILAREVRRSDTTLAIRDTRGDPVWKYMLPGAN